jgi:hypothetical protein
VDNNDFKLQSAHMHEFDDIQFVRKDIGLTAVTGTVSYGREIQSYVLFMHFFIEFEEA